jgi:hypothetical protein
MVLRKRLDLRYHFLMNAPNLSQDLLDAAQPLPMPTPVSRFSELEREMTVSGRIIKRDLRQLDFVLRDKTALWIVEAELDGGLTMFFGCTDDDMDSLTQGARAIDKDQRFIATVETGTGPAPGGLDMEPSSVFYLCDFKLLTQAQAPYIQSLAQQKHDRAF